MHGLLQPKAPSSTTANALATTGASVNVSNAAAPVAGQVLGTSSATQGDWVYPVPEGWVSVTDYGAVGDGVTNDDAAFQAAVATGKNVYVPPGTVASPKHYLLSQTIEVGISQTIYSPPSWYFPPSTGWTYESTELPYITTCILWANTSANCFSQKKSHSMIDGVLVVQHYSYTPTAGAAFYQGDATTMVRNPKMHNCGSIGTFFGYHTSNKVLYSELSHCLFEESRYADIYINLSTPYGALKWFDIRSQSGKRGLLVDGCDTSKIVGLTINNTSVAQSPYASPFELSGANYGVYQMHFSNLIIEDPYMTGNTIVIGNSAYANPVQNNTIDCFHILGRGVPTDQQLVLGTNSKRNCISNLNSMSMKYIDNGDSNELTGGRIHTQQSITGSGTAMELNGNNAMISNVRIKDYVNALKFGTAGNYSLISNLNLNNNTNALDAASDAAAKATGKGRGIIGLADWG